MFIVIAALCYLLIGIFTQAYFMKVRKEKHDLTLLIFLWPLGFIADYLTFDEKEK